MWSSCRKNFMQAGCGSITQGEKLETSAKFCIECIIAALKEGIYEIRVFVSRVSPPLEHSATLLFCFQIVHVRWTACVQTKFEGVNKEPSK